jgi:aspartate racemase
VITQSPIEQDAACGDHIIGIITGSGPEAGIDLWQKMIVVQRARLGARFRGDLDAPHIVAFSVPQLGRSMDLRRHEAQVWSTLRQACIEIADHCTHFAIACNTLHYYAPRIAELQLAARFVSIVDAARAAIADYGVDRVALLGADPVIDLEGGLSPYAALRSEVGVEVPTTSLQSLIFDVKRQGGTHPAVVQRFEALLRSLSAEVVLLACTELPLIKCQAGGKTLVDLTERLAGMLVDAGGAPTDS